MFDQNSLRMGKLLEVMDILAYDSSKLYLKNTPFQKDTFFTTVATSGLQFQKELNAD